MPHVRIDEYTECHPEDSVLYMAANYSYSDTTRRNILASDMPKHTEAYQAAHLAEVACTINSSANSARIRLANALLHTFGSNTSLTIGW